MLPNATGKEGIPNKVLLMDLSKKFASEQAIFRRAFS